MNYDKCTYISWDKYEESPEIKVVNGDILLVKTGSSYGKCALVTELPQKATINPQFVVLKYILIKEQYLTMILQSDYARKNYNNFVLGTAIPTFTQAILGNMLIPLPPIIEQQRIVAEVESWFALIDQIEQGKADLQIAIKQTKRKILDLAIHGKLVPQDSNDEPASELLKRINPKAEITCDNGHSGKLPQGWCTCKYTDIYTDISSKPYQILKSQIQESGKYPVVSQSAKHIEGFTDSCNVFSHSLPCILFGDHTRVVKYIDFDFVVGADGVKIQCPKVNARWAYYIMEYVSFHIVNKGYSRHFGQVVKFTYALPPLAEQQRIVVKIEELFS